MRILFCKTGWMKYYNGQTTADKVEGGGGWPDKHEIYNFSEYEGYFYGYVNVPGTGYNLRIERLQKSVVGDYVDNVLVVWIAKNPESEGIRIIGWYKDARVYRTYQILTKGSPKEQYNIDYNIITKIENGLLLPEKERNYTIPIASSTTGGVGSKSHVWYADSEKDQDIRQSVLRYIDNITAKKKL